MTVWRVRHQPNQGSTPHIFPMMKFVLSLLAAALALATLGVSHACAQANLTFSGGLGAPLTLTLNSPVTYTITVSNNHAPIFLFQGVGNAFNNSSPAVSGTITFTIDGGAAQTFTTMNSGNVNGSRAANDVYTYGALPGVAVGDTVVLNTGTLTTTANFAGAPPASGSYQTFITNPAGSQLDAVNGVSAAPEPSTWAFVAAGMGLLGVTLHRRRAVRV